MVTRTTVFDVVKRTHPLTYTYAGCGNKRRKSISVENTINPFNTNKEGFPKTREEVTQDVSTKLKEKVENFNNLCTKCQE